MDEPLSIQHPPDLTLMPPAKSADGRNAALIVRAGAHRCAISLADIIETMRPLPVKPVPGMPDHLEGMAIIRGSATPVVRLAALLETDASAAPGRLVVLRVDDRRVALGVDAIVGVHALDEATLQILPPLLGNARPELIAGIGRLDRELLVVLQAARIMPPEVWSSFVSTLEATR